MVAIAANKTPTATAPAQSGVAAGAAATGAKPAPPGGDSAAVVDLSDRARALLEKARSDQAVADALTDTFDQILAKRTDALSDRLAEAFGKMNVPPEYATHLQVSKFGSVSSEGPWKDKIEKFFSDSPELAAELKKVSGLHALKAAQVALDMYNEEKKSVGSRQQEAEAWTRYNLRSINIQTLNGVMTMKDGKLRSAAMDYIEMLADPKGAKSGKPATEVKDRLA
jgi:hypothetical protein